MNGFLQCRAPGSSEGHGSQRSYLRTAVLAAGCFALAAFTACGVEDSGLFDLSLEDLSKVEIKSDIASIKAKSIREQPGIVSVVTGKQIRETGARDLSDVLMLVPGFALDTDVQSMVGLTFRGLQGQEGKVLLIVDGLEINESTYGSLPILNHISAEMIEQVEIIRGPGSAAYGGSAGLSVVRVTTRGASQNGGYAVVSPGWTEGRFFENYTIGTGYTIDGLRVSMNSSYSDNFLSNRKYTSVEGATIDLTHVSDMNPGFLDFGIGYNDLDVRFIYDAYRYDDAIYYGEPPLSASSTRFDSILTSVKYDIHATGKIKITPQFTYRHQIPWYVKSEEVGNYDIEADRYQADLVSVAELTANSGLMIGARYQRDEAHALDTAFAGTDAAVYYDGSDKVSYDDYAFFAQYDLDTSWANLSAGGRYEHQDAVGGHFVPRVALTKAWRDFHVKALYSEAARIPAINVLGDAVGGKLEAEQTKNYEVEAGYRFNKDLSLVANVFYMQVLKPIQFTADASGGASDGYNNGTNNLSTCGLETELRWDRPEYSTYLSYSFYRPDDNDASYVRGDDSHFLAAPAHKVGLSETWHVMKALDWNVNGFWISKRFAYMAPDGLSELAPEFVVNTFVNYQYRRYSFGIGVANVFDVDRYAPQPYAGGSAPVPLKGREGFVKLGITF